MKVSLIIPHFNRLALLRETIASVRNQTYENWEIIIVDDGSEQDVVNVLQELSSPHLKLIQRKDGAKGPSRCRNIGAAAASGELLLFLDSDDLLAPHCLEQRVAVINEDQELSMAVFLIQNFEQEPGDRQDYFNIDAPLPDLPKLFLKNQNPWQTMAPIWRKKAFLSSGGFDEALLFMEDPDLHLRVITNQGFKYVIRYDLPADCYYRINHIDETKKDFYYNSVYYRILFYKKVCATYPLNFVKLYRAEIRIGLYAIVKTFLYSRKQQLPALYRELTGLMATSKLFSVFEIKSLSILINWGNVDNWLAKKIKLRGVCYKLLPTR